MDDRLRVHDHVDPVIFDIEEFVRLDDLEPLVHERRRVDGDLGAHRPGRVGECLLDGHLGQLLAGPTAERATRCREHHPVDGAPTVVTTQALVDRTMLAVDRQQFGAGRVPCLAHDRSGGDEGLLVGEAQSSPRFEGGKGDREPGESHHAVDYHLGSRGCLGQRRPSCQDLSSDGNAVDQFGGERGIGDRHYRWSKALRLLDEEVEGPGRTDRYDFVPVRPGYHDVERLGTD